MLLADFLYERAQRFIPYSIARDVRQATAICDRLIALWTKPEMAVALERGVDLHTRVIKM
jgi:hypothetical protein